MTMRILTLTVKTNITMLVRSKRAAFMMAIKKSMNGMLGKAYPTHHGLLAGTVPKPSVNLYLYPDTPRESHARQKRPRQGVFFRSGSDPEVRASVYGTITPTSLSVLVPATLSGPLNVRVANKINGSVRSFTFMDAITPIT